MSAFSANPGFFIFMVVALVAAIGYYGYGALNRSGGEIIEADAIVIDKKYTPPGTTYNTTIAGGRAWTQSSEIPEAYTVALKVGTEQTAGIVTKELYETLSIGDKVKAKLRRTRFSKTLETLEIHR